VQCIAGRAQKSGSIIQDQISVNQQDRYQQESQGFIDAFRNKLFGQSLGYTLRNLLAKSTKPFYYYETPVLKKIYPYLLKLPPYIIYDFSKQQFSLTNEN